MGAIASQITSLTIVYWIVYSDADQRKHQSSASLAFLRGIHRGQVNSPHKWPVMRKMFLFDDVIMIQSLLQSFPIIYLINDICWNHLQQYMVINQYSDVRWNPVSSENLYWQGYLWLEPRVIDRKLTITVPCWEWNGDILAQTHNWGSLCTDQI